MQLPHGKAGARAIVWLIGRRNGAFLSVQQLEHLRLAYIGGLNFLT